MKKVSLLEKIRLFIFPPLVFISIIFLLLVCFAPDSKLPGQLSLVTIHPGLYVPLGNSSFNGDGPSIRLGFLHSCSQANNSAKLHCQTMTPFPKYDFSDLTSSFSNSPEIRPVPTLGLWLIFCIFFWGFFSSFYCIRVWGRSSVGKGFNATMGGYKIMRWFTIFASVGYLFGMIVIFTAFSRLKKKVNNFNKGITALEPTGPKVQAELSRGLAFGGIALILSLPVMVVMVLDASKLYGQSTVTVANVRDELDEGNMGESDEESEEHKNSS